MSDHACPKCGGDNPPEARFCRHCRTYLRGVPAPAAPAEPPVTTIPDAAAERRDVGTVPLAQSSRVTPDAIIPTAETVRPVEPAPPADAVAPVAPAEAAKRSAGATAPIDVPEREPGPNERRCPACSHINEVGRRFCGHCGEALQELQPAAAPGTAAPTEDRSFGTAVKKATHRGEYAYDRSLAMRSRLFRLVGALAALGIAGSMLPPWGSGVRSAIGDRVSGLFPKHYAAIPDITATGRGDALVLNGRPVVGFDASRGIDGQDSTAWLSPWTASGPLKSPRAVCENSPATQRMLIHFPKAASVDRVTITAVTTDDNVASFVYPARVIDLCFGPNSAKRLTLDPNKQQQSFVMHIPDVRQVVLVIANVGLRSKADSHLPNAAALADITFEHQK